MNDILLVRHAEPAVTNRYFGAGSRGSDADPGLGPRGESQALALGKTLLPWKPEVLIASPLRRAMETAAPLAETTGLPIETDERWMELDFGSWEGLTYREISDASPEEWNRWCEDPRRNAPPGGETQDQLEKRVGAAFDTLVDRSAEGPVVVFAHGGSIRAVLGRVLTLDRGRYWSADLDYASVGRISFDEDGNPGLAQWNLCLPGKLMK